MKLKEFVKIMLVVASVSTLVACSSGRKPQGEDMAVNDANAAYNDDDAKASGAGEETSFGSGGGKKVVASRTYYFDFDSNVVHDQDKPAISANANKIAGTGAKVMLEGHTDPRGSREYNIALGERRAKSVADIMSAKGASPEQIRIVSYGAEKLAAQGHSEDDYQLDRRVVLVNVKS
jgi:peptidoglycan-associated lipoprotein